jgi:hypothetical protein
VPQSLSSLTGSELTAHDRKALVVDRRDKAELLPEGRAVRRSARPRRGSGPGRTQLPRSPVWRGRRRPPPPGGLRSLAGALPDVARNTGDHGRQRASGSCG